MESTSRIELTDKSVYPDEAVLERVLGESYPAYRALLDLFGRNGMICKWRYYMIHAARKVGKLTPCVFEIRNPKILNDIDQVMQFKMQIK